MILAFSTASPWKAKPWQSYFQSAVAKAVTKANTPIVFNTHHFPNVSVRHSVCPTTSKRAPLLRCRFLVCGQRRWKTPSAARRRRSTEALFTSRCRRRAAPARPRHPPAPWPPRAPSSPPLPRTQRPSPHELLESCCSSGAAYPSWWSRHSAHGIGALVSIGTAAGSISC